MEVSAPAFLPCNVDHVATAKGGYWFVYRQKVKESTYYSFDWGRLASYCTFVRHSIPDERAWAVCLDGVHCTLFLAQ